MASNKRKILLFADWYEPGYKAGGPIRSCANFVHNMQSEYSVYVFTTDRDLGSDESYKDIEKYYTSSYSQYAINLLQHNSINKNGTVNPVKLWMIEAAYDD